MLQEVGMFVSRVAAALVGGVVGAIATAIVLWWLCRMTVNRQPPRPVRRLLHILGGLAGALAAVLFLPIGFGGFGLGSGGLGLGPGGGGFQPAAVVAPEPPPAPSKSSEPPPRTEQRARVVMLGGPLVKGDAFYRWADEPAPRTLAEIQARLRTRIDANPPLTVLEIAIYFEDSLSRQSAPVVQLSDWATQAGLSVRIVGLPGHIPQ